MYSSSAPLNTLYVRYLLPAPPQTAISGCLMRQQGCLSTSHHICIQRTAVKREGKNSACEGVSGSQPNQHFCFYAFYQNKSNSWAHSRLADSFSSERQSGYAFRDYSLGLSSPGGARQWKSSMKHISSGRVNNVLTGPGAIVADRHSQWWSRNRG